MSALGKSLPSSCICTYSKKFGFPTLRYHQARQYTWHLLPVFEFRSRSCQRRLQDREWNPSTTSHPRPARQDARFFSHSMRCRNGSSANPTSGFSIAIGPSQARLSLCFTVGCNSTMSRSISIPTLSRPFSSCLASVISSSTLPADTLGLLALISLLYPSLC